MSPSIDDEKLVAYLLGELEKPDLEKVETALESDSKLRAALDELKSTAEIASRALETAEPQSFSLTSKQRDEVRSAAAGPGPKSDGEDSNPFSLANLQSLDVESEPDEAAGEARWRAGDESSGLVDIRSMKLEDEEDEKSGLTDLVALETRRESTGLAKPPLAARGRLRKLLWPLVAGGALVVAGAGVLIAVLLIEPSAESSAESGSHREMIAALQREIEELQQGGGGGSQEVVDLERRLVAERAAAEAEGGSEKQAESHEAGKAGRRAAKKKGSAGGAKKSASAESSGGSSFGPKKASGSASSELDDLLGGSAAPVKKKKNKAAAGGGGGSSGKLSRSQVQAGMRKVAGAVRRCGQGEGGRVVVKVVISPTGRVKSAEALGAHAGTPVGRCAERAVFRARFDRSAGSLTVKHPFALD